VTITRDRLDQPYGAGWRRWSEQGLQLRWARTSVSKRGRRHQSKASRPGQRTGRRRREKVGSNYQFDFQRVKMLSAKVKYIFHLKLKLK